MTVFSLRNTSLTFLIRYSSEIPLHEKQHFRNNTQRNYNIFLIFHNWQKYHIFLKTKINENIIFSIIFVIFCNISIEQGNYKKWLNDNELAIHIFRRLITNLDDYINSKCLYDILHHLEKHSTRLVNFSYTVVYSSSGCRQS